ARRRSPRAVPAAQRLVRVRTRAPRVPAGGARYARSPCGPPGQDNRGMRPPTRSARVVLVAASAAQAAVSFVSFGLPAIGPQLRHAYGLSLAELGAILTANLLGAGVALIPAGVAVDRFGSRVAMLVGTALA